MDTLAKITSLFMVPADTTKTVVVQLGNRQCAFFDFVGEPGYHRVDGKIIKKERVNLDPFPNLAGGQGK